MKMEKIYKGWENGRDFTLKQGDRYVVKPRNPRKLKHRGRECIFLDSVAVSESHHRDFMAKVRFTDNNRIGRVEFRDLHPVSSQEGTLEPSE